MQVGELMDIRHWFLKYSWAVNLLLLAVIAFICAKTANLYLVNSFFSVPAEKSRVALVSLRQGSGYNPPVESILDRDLFDAKREDEFFASPEVSEGDTSDLMATDLRLSLIGIAFQGEDSILNLATIKNLKDQKTEVYRKGDPVPEDAVVNEVKIDRVILARNNGNLEELLLEAAKEKKKKKGSRGYKEALEDASPEDRRKQFEALREKAERRQPKVDLSDRIKQVGDNEFVIQKSAIDEALSNLNSIVTQARVIPNFQGRGDERTVDGFRIYRIQPGSIFQYLGLQNGDVIKSINGDKMDSVEKGIQLMQALRNETSFSMDIERQRNPVEMQYEVE
jgi:type II secretion system protein C